MKSLKTILLLVTFLFMQTSYLAAQSTNGEQFKEGINWYKFEEAQKLAKKSDKKVLVFAEASWCTYCKRMKSDVFPKPGVQQAMTRYFYPVKIDIESERQLTFKDSKMTERQFSRKMRVSATPTFIFLDKNSSVLGTQPGFLEHDIYRTLLTYIGTDAYQDQKFKSYLKEQK
jgi:thioredoxin-related protein